MYDVPPLWTSPDDIARAAVMAELRREVVPGHPLGDAARRAAAVWSRCQVCAATSVRLQDGTYALVWLTWSGRREPARRLPVVLLEDERATWAAMADHAEDHCDALPREEGDGPRAVRRQWNVGA